MNLLLRDPSFKRLLFSESWPTSKEMDMAYARWDNSESPSTVMRFLTPSERAFPPDLAKKHFYVNSNGVDQPGKA
ncbi:hypothetical protein KIN20_024431 [Parelaphostrongylus tenuis]|uniref:Uncharacterized protein n=1 Tax=Parelaphostrongylus tenuis TaxID=148309 RepID=A0AAD5NCU3_PARTN|nr:hypothetical protein KIN20_024431 [Parelaphostrongylus tenuis]